MKSGRRQQPKSKKEQQPPFPRAVAGKAPEDKTPNSTENGDSQTAETKRQKNTRPISAWARFKQTHIANQMIAAFTGLTAIAAIITIIVYMQQVKAMNSQLSIMTRQWEVMEKQLTAMRNAARPWVEIGEAPGDGIDGPWFDPNETVRVDCRVVPKNLGSYPATIFWRHAELVIDPDPNSAKRRMEALRLEPARHGTGHTLFPGTDRIAEQSPLTLSRPKETLVASRDDCFGLYVIKHVLYGDQFGNRHCTQITYHFEVYDGDSIQTTYRLSRIAGRGGAWKVYDTYAD